VSADVEVFRSVASTLVESIFWDARTDELAWVDIAAGTFHRARLDGAVDGSDDRVVSLPAPVSAVQPAHDGGYVASLQDSIVELDADGRIRGTVARVRHAHAATRFNEGKVDPFGRFVVGSMDGGGNPDAAVYAFTADGQTRELHRGFTITNGMEWSDAGDVMYVTDTTTETVYRAPYAADSARLAGLEPFLVGRKSDGIARDTAGCFWNAVYGAGEVVRWLPDGTAGSAVPIPAPNVTSVGFGGRDLRTLFVGTARENMSDEQLAAAPLSGALFAVRGTGQGRPVHTFGR
jgi:sugar lactone lactonase YvrE